MKDRSIHKIIPENELKCVWMDAGVTEFKLCDQEFRCETCEFDKTIRKRQSEKTDPDSQRASVSNTEGRALTADGLFKKMLDRNLESLRAVEIPQDRTYNRYYWVRQNENGKFRIGINHIFANFLHPILSVVILKAPMNIHRHNPFCWIILPGGAVTLRSPFETIISCFNPALQHKPNLLNTSPFEDGWIMEISAKSKSLAGFVPSSDWKQVMNRLLQNAEHSFLQAFRHLHPSAGVTLFDGGIGVESIEGILGSKVYLEIVNRILHQPS